MLIECPYCGLRNEDEFRCGGEAHIERPADPQQADAAAWGNYLYMRANTRGRYSERWCHSFGCGQWFNLARDTRDHGQKVSYRIGEAPMAGARTES